MPGQNEGGKIGCAVREVLLFFAALRCAVLCCAVQKWLVQLGRGGNKSSWVGGR